MAWLASPRQRSGWDRFGILAATLCAIHCAIVPLAFATASSLTLALFSWNDPHHGWAVLLLQVSRWEWLVVSIALANAALSFAGGGLRHRDWRPSAGLLLASISFLVAIASPWSAMPALHAGFAVIGGGALAGAHALNLRLTRLRSQAG